MLAQSQAGGRSGHSIRPWLSQAASGSVLPCKHYQQLETIRGHSAFALPVADFQMQLPALPTVFPLGRQTFSSPGGGSLIPSADPGLAPSLPPTRPGLVGVNGPSDLRRYRVVAEL